MHTYTQVLLIGVNIVGTYFHMNMMGHFVRHLLLRLLHVDGLGQDCSISTAYALDILQSFNKPSMDHGIM